MYIQTSGPPVEMDGERQYAGAGPMLGREDNEALMTPRFARRVSRHVSTDPATSYMALAAAKIAISKARAAATSGNCGAAQEALGDAWQKFTAYAQLAAAVGQSNSTAVALLKMLTKVETLAAMTCSSMHGAGPASVGTGDICANLPAGPEKDRCYKEQMLQKNLVAIQRSESEQKRMRMYLLVGGGLVAAGVIGYFVFRKK